MGQTLKGNADIIFIVRSLGGNNFWLSQFSYEKLLSRNTTLFDFTATIEIQQYRRDYLTNIWDFKNLPLTSGKGFKISYFFIHKHIK